MLRIHRHQCLAQPQHVHIDGTLLDEYVIAPYVIEQLAAGEYALRVPDEKCEQLEFGQPHPDAAATDLDFVACWIDFQRTVDNRFSALFRGPTPEYGTYARD